MRVDTSNLSHKTIRETVRKAYSYEGAERLGREAAFKDVDKHGFCHAYEQSQVMDLWHESALIEWTDRWLVQRFMYGYTQVVEGYYLACFCGAA